MKIALLTLPLNSNYGGVLQAFALKSHLTRLGHEVWLIDNRKRLKPVSNAFLKTVLRRAVESLFHPKEIFAEMNTLLTQDYKKSEIEKFIYRRLTPKTQPVFDAADYAELAASGNGFDLYIVGSDQVWRPRYAGDPEPYFFSFLEGSGARRISYAASFGAGDCEYTREQRMRCGELLAGFEGVSVREDTAVGQCREYFGCDRAVHVLDPAMLLTADDYRTLFTAGSAPSDTLYCYLFRVKPGARHILQDFAERHNLRIVRTTDRPNAARGKMPGIGEWLAGLHEARYVITDSFHACVFCILFQQALRRLHQPQPRLGAHPLAVEAVRTRVAHPLIGAAGYLYARHADRLGGGGPDPGAAARRVVRIPRCTPLPGIRYGNGSRAGRTGGNCQGSGRNGQTDPRDQGPAARNRLKETYRHAVPRARRSCGTDRQAPASRLMSATVART